MDEKPLIISSAGEKELAAEGSEAGATANASSESKGERSDETDSYLLAVDRAIRAYAKLKSRSDEQGVKIFLNRNLLYLQAADAKKSKRAHEAHDTPPVRKLSLPSRFVHRFPSLVRYESACEAAQDAGSKREEDSEIKFQFLGFYDSASQEQWTTTSADMRVDLLVDVQNVRKNSTHQYIRPLFDAPRALHVNESESEWLKRSLDSVTLDFGEIFDTVRRRFGPVRVDLIRLYIQVVVMEMRRARREFPAANKHSEPQGADSKAFHRQYPAKYAASHVIWQRRKPTDVFRVVSHGRTSLCTAAFDDCSSDNYSFSLASRFGEYEQRLRVIRVGNRPSDCAFSEPCEDIDEPLVADSLDSQASEETVSKTAKRTAEDASAVNQNGESATNGSHSHCNGTAKVVNRARKQACQSECSTSKSLHNFHQVQESFSKPWSLTQPTRNHMRGALLDELHQSPVLRFRIVPAYSSDRLADQRSSVWLHVATVQNDSSNQAVSKQSKPAALRNRVAKRTRRSDSGSSTECGASNEPRRTKRSAALDAANMMRVRDETSSQTRSPTNGNKRAKCQSDNSAEQLGWRRAAAKTCNGFGSAGDCTGQPILCDTPEHSDGSDELDDEENDPAALGVNGNADAKSRCVAVRSADSLRQVRYVFADTDGAGVWRIVAVPEFQCLFCSLRTCSFQALVVHLAYVHLQFHIEADLEVRCIGLRPKARGEPSGFLLADLHELGYRPIVHLPVAADRLSHYCNVNNLMLQTSGKQTSPNSLSTSSTHRSVVAANDNSQRHICNLHGCNGYAKEITNETIVVETGNGEETEQKVTVTQRSVCILHQEECCATARTSSPLVRNKYKMEAAKPSPAPPLRMHETSSAASRKTVLTVANSVGLYFSRCYATGNYEPQRRAEETYVIVRRCDRHARQRLILDAVNAKAVLREPLKAASECPTRIDYNRPGLNRVFFHTLSYLPVLPTELDEDSEAENDPAWLHTRIATQLDDVIDVNDGEKQVMTLWCSHLLGHTNEFCGDRKVVRALESFVDEYTLSLNARRKNFILLLASLCDYGVLNAADVRAAMRRLDDAVAVALRAKTMTPDNH